MPPDRIPVALQQQQQAHTNSIFFVHPSKGLDLVLVTPLLNGSNLY